MPYKDKEARKLYSKQYAESHKEERKIYSKRYYCENKESLNTYSSNYYNENRNEIIIKSNAWKKANGDRVLELDRNRRVKWKEMGSCTNCGSVRDDTGLVCKKCKTISNKKCKIWQSLNKEKSRASATRSRNKKIDIYRKKSREYQKEYRLNHIEEVRMKSRERSRKKIKTIKNVIDGRMSSQIGLALRGNKNFKKWVNLVGYTAEDLKKHIESQFTDGMNWDVFMKSEIHIDHIIPKNNFKYQSADDIEFVKCWSLENLQPLWATTRIINGVEYIGNLNKNKKIIKKETI